ncbi:MAG: diguanylate cyclase [Magnetococcales bacterium]|nr:diguanylate cyclase [Magnetococcales bacterium]MBF0115338.1 diguanylate cyclase [Magnetococcales bacterium]
MNDLSSHAFIPVPHLDELVKVLASTMVDRDSLRNTLEAMVNAVLVLSSETTIVWANQSAADMMECPVAELVGLDIDTLLDPERPWGELCMVETSHQGAIRNREAWFLSCSKRRLPILFSASVIRSPNGQINGFVCSAQDISEQIHLREALQASHESFQAIVERSADGTLIVNQVGVVRYLNQAAEQLLGRTLAELQGTHFGQAMIADGVTEVDIVRKNGLLGIAEMRSVNTVWLGEPATLVSLRDVTENVQLREQLHQLSMEDALTGLNNRRGFILLAEQECKQARRLRAHILVFFIDLDGMKQINDTLGHKIGDLALLETATILRQVFRKSDVLARQGGDEFLALAFREAGDDLQAAQEGITRRIHEEVANRNAQPERRYSLSLSVGVTIIPPDSTITIEESIQQADSAMYLVKTANRRNRTT